MALDKYGWDDSDITSAFACGMSLADPPYNGRRVYALALYEVWTLPDDEFALLIKRRTDVLAHINDGLLIGWYSTPADAINAVHNLVVGA